MAVAFRSAGAKASTSSSSVNVPYPAGIAAGDLLIMQAGTANAITLNIPSGWTRLFGPLAAGTSNMVHWLYKIASGSESGNLTLTATGNSSILGIMACYSGCDTTTPIDVYATQTMPTSGTSATCPTVTTTKANTMLLRMYWDWSGSATISPPGGLTERYDTFDSLLNYALELADVIQTSAGASGTSVATLSSATSGGLAATVALAPVAAGAAPVADFTGTPTTGLATLAVTFTDASTNTPTAWSWDFGDTGTSSSQNPSHNYTTPGVYTVVLIASNATGSDTKTRTAYITVTETIVYAAGGGIEIA